ncbi:hypothetical protein CRD18_10880 (plasmid) [Corynebacterium sp. LK31]|uniref:DUF3846 domain-containing protein n=1 Tax=Corynebacterium sp. LK31 TaxID=2044576 RepID=UPI001651B88A|nr:DUF3846 domain-containing protein [Corynebacterium sp. LK31]MBC6798093.1 hypothetical protein [Corynebacterium sp. LK31]
MATATAFEVKPNAPMKTVNVEVDNDGSITYAELQKATNARLVDVVSLETSVGALDFWLDEEGMFATAPEVNTQVMWLMHSVGAPLHQFYVGDCLVTTADDMGRTLPLNDEQIRFLENLAQQFDKPTFEHNVLMPMMLQRQL